MKKALDFALKALKFIWGLVKNNLVLKIMAILFAVVLWSYVLAETNPVREKPLDGVPVSYLYADQLDAQDLAISESLSNWVETVDVRVKVNQSYVRSVTSEAVRATVDLSKINGAGEKTLEINVVPTNTYCQIVDYSPKTVTLTVDAKVDRTIPVAFDVTGSVPAGYYVGDPVAEPDSVTLTGASSDIEMVSRAVCTVDIGGLTAWDKQSMDVAILDSEGNELDPGIFGELPSVIVDMTLMPKKTVEVKAETTGQLAPGYEIPEGGIVCDPAYVVIYGEASVLANITSIALEPCSISNMSTDVVEPLAYVPPEGVTVLDADNKAQVTITIREEMREETFNGVGIDIRNVGDGLTAELEQAEVDVTVKAGLSAMSMLRSSDVVPYVDLNGLDAGPHEVTLQFEIPEGFAMENFSAKVEEQPVVTVTVTITEG